MAIVSEAVKKQATQSSTWMAIISICGAIAASLTTSTEPHLVTLGLVLSGVFKIAEKAHDAYVTGKKLEVEKQYVSETAAVPPSIIASAKTAGVSAGYIPPAGQLNAIAPGVIPQPPIISAPANHVPHG